MSAISSGPNRLQGNIYLLSWGSSLVILSIGVFFVLGGSEGGEFGFGIPTSSLLSRNKHAGHAYISITGVRDISLAFTSIVFTALRDRRAVGVASAAGIVATVGDAIVIHHYSKQPYLTLTSHIIPCVPLILLTSVLLAGNTKSTKTKQ